ncbi:MAG TPA: response regulator [Gemmatimonadales bacterium]|nr:response regulator [Gemmatimonadales bacterium]
MQHGGPPTTNGDSPLLLPGRGELIFIVDDDEKLLKALGRMLRSLGFAVLTAGDGEAAIETIKGCKTPIDAILADVVMPRLGGKELVDRLAVEGVRPGVIYMSGYDDPTHMAAVLRTGMPLLHKPFTLHALVVMLRSVLDKRAAH